MKKPNWKAKLTKNKQDEYKLELKPPTMKKLKAKKKQKRKSLWDKAVEKRWEGTKYPPFAIVCGKE